MNDGKWLEAQVKKFGDHYSKKLPQLTYERLYDAKAARGKFPPQAADYHFNFQRLSIYLECKELTKGLVLRKQGFSQFPRMRRKMMAGAYGVLVTFTHEDSLYRIIDLRQMPHDVGSWKLNELVEGTPNLDGALLDTFGAFATETIFRPYSGEGVCL